MGIALADAPPRICVCRRPDLSARSRPWAQRLQRTGGSTGRVIPMVPRQRYPRVLRPFQGEKGDDGGVIEGHPARRLPPG